MREGKIPRDEALHVCDHEQHLNPYQPLEVDGGKNGLQYCCSSFEADRRTRHMSCPVKCLRRPLNAGLSRAQHLRLCQRDIDPSVQAEKKPSSRIKGGQSFWPCRITPHPGFSCSLIYYIPRILCINPRTPEVQ